MTTLPTNIAICRSRKQYVKYNAGTQANFTALLASLDTEQEWDVEIDGMVNLTSSWTQPTGVHLRPASQGCGLYFGSSAVFSAGTSAWTSHTSGTALTANIAAGDSYFRIPNGVTLSKGDVVILSSTDTLTNIISNGTSTMYATALRVVDYTDTISSVDYAFLTKPIPFAMTTAQAASVYKPTTFVRNAGWHGLTILTDREAHSAGFGSIYANKFVMEDCHFTGEVPAHIFVYGAQIQVRNNNFSMGAARADSSAHMFICGFTNDALFQGNAVRGHVHCFVDQTTSGRYAGSHYVTVDNNDLELIPPSTDAALELPLAGIASHPSNFYSVISKNRIAIAARDDYAMDAAIGTAGNFGIIQDNVIWCGGRTSGLTTGGGKGISIAGYQNECVGNRVSGLWQPIVIDQPPSGSYLATGTLGNHIIKDNILSSGYYADIAIADNGGAPSVGNVIMGNVSRTANPGGSGGAVYDINTTGNRIIGNYIPKGAGAKSIDINALAETDVRVEGNWLPGYTDTSKTGFDGTNAAALATAYAAKNYIDP